MYKIGVATLSSKIMAKMLKACSKRKKFSSRRCNCDNLELYKVLLLVMVFILLMIPKKEITSTFNNYTIPKSMSNVLKDVKNTHIAFIINVCDDFGTTKK